MLPVAYQDVSSLMVVEVETWRAILVAAKASWFAEAEVTHAALWEAMVTNDVGTEFLNALAVLTELGNDAGRESVLQAAEDRQVELEHKADEPAQELAARLWIASRTNAVLANVLVMARTSRMRSGSERTFEELHGRRFGVKRAIDLNHLKTAVAQWCIENKLEPVVEVFAYERDDEWHCEVLRGERAKRVLAIQAGRPDILNFNPATSDHLRYEPETARLGIATRSPRLFKMYQATLGTLIADEEGFFGGEEICSLEPLQKRRVDLFHDVSPAIARVDVVELQWRRGDRDRVLVRGRDCFRVLEDLGAQLIEGRLVAAKLVVTFVGGGRPSVVSIQVPKVIDISPGPHEHLVERMLTSVGIRGTFGKVDGRRDLWCLYPWRMSAAEWRARMTDFDKYAKTMFRPIVLETVTHPDHPASPGALVVETLSPHTTIGVSDDVAIPIRTLTESDVEGLELDIERVANGVATALALTGGVREVAAGLWMLGSRALVQHRSIAVFFASRAPSDSVAATIHGAVGSNTPVVLCPEGCAPPVGANPWIPCRVPFGPYDDLLMKIVYALNLERVVPAWLWAPEDLVVDEAQGVVWFQGTQLLVDSNTNAFKLVAALAKRGSEFQDNEDLNQAISASRKDSETAKQAKRAWNAVVKKTFSAKGLPIPAEMIRSRTGGYELAVAVRFVPGSESVS